MTTEKFHILFMKKTLYLNHTVIQIEEDFFQQEDEVGVGVLKLNVFSTLFELLPQIGMRYFQLHVH